MTTNYNINIEQTIEKTLEKAHVNHLGRVLEGHDNNCDKTYQGRAEQAQQNNIEVKLDDGRTLHYWKPAKDEHYYDLDELETYRANVLMNISKTEQYLAEGPDDHERGELETALTTLQEIYRHIERLPLTAYERIGLPDDAPDIKYEW